MIHEQDLLSGLRRIASFDMFVSMVFVVWSRNEVVEEGEGDIGSRTSCRK